jgi:hypothetical protein
MELLYKIALIYMVLDVIASIYVMVKYRDRMVARLRGFLNPPQPEPEYCCDNRWEFDECDCEEDVEPPKPRMKRAIDNVFGLGRK